jgi:hypothetical protein
MGNYIVKIKDHYLEWSTIMDAPVTFGMDRVELQAHIAEEYGLHGVDTLPERMARVNVKGVSSYNHDSVEELISGNRAGPNEKELTLEEIYQAYCLMNPIRDGWKVPTMEEKGHG